MCGGGRSAGWAEVTRVGGQSSAPGDPSRPVFRVPRPCSSSQCSWVGLQSWSGVQAVHLDCADLPSPCLGYRGALSAEAWLPEQRA